MRSSFVSLLILAMGTLLAGCSSGGQSASGTTPAAKPTEAPPPAAAFSPSASPATAAGASPAAATSPSASPVAAASGPTKKLSIAYSNLIFDSLPLWVAKESGIFARNGLDVDLQYIASSNAFAALLAGQVEATAGGGSEVVSGVAGGADVVVIVNLLPIYPYFMESPADIRTPQDLKGKLIAITNPGATFDIASRVALRNEGLDPDQDVQWIKTGSVINVQSALLSGQVQGGLAQVPDTLRLEAGGMHPVIDMSTLNAPAAGTVISMQRGYVDANKDVVQNIADSVLQAVAYEKQNRDFTVGVLKQYLNSTDDAGMQATYEYVMAKVTPSAPSPEQFADGVAVLAEQNPKVKEVDLAKVLEPSYFQDAQNRNLAR
jgi:NitT/TauT family transport system substrate-binding protein